MGIFSGNVLYYPGCVTKFLLPSILNNYETLLNQFGIKYVKLATLEKSCGVEALEAGYRKTFHDLMEHNEALFKEHKISKIITNCPRCYKTFNEHYSVKAEHIIDVLMKHTHKLKPKHEKITYYDPCTLGRKCGIYEEPRDVLKAIGFKVVDLKLCRGKTLCCGAGGGLKRNSPQIANKIAQMVLAQVETESVVTTDPLCYQHLKENAKTVKVYELSEVLL